MIREVILIPCAHILALLIFRPIVSSSEMTKGRSVLLPSSSMVMCTFSFFSSFHFFAIAHLLLLPVQY